MGSHEAYLLKWDNYLTHIVKEFHSFKTGNELVDVTLSCQGKRIGAHKMLLSACSPYFKDLFRENPCKHPIVIIQNVKFEDLEAILKFIYHGEVEIADSHLVSFLTTAELLEVKGLVDCDRNPNNTTKGSSVYSPDTLTSPSEAPKSKEIDPSPDVKSLAPHTPVTSHFNHSPKKRKLSKTVCDLLESENSSKQSHIPTQKADSSDINPNSSSSCGEDSGPGEEVGRNLIKSESIEIFRVVPHEFLDDPVEVFSNTLKRKLDPAKDRIDNRKTTVVSSEFTRCSPKFLNPPFDQNSNRHDFELELMQVKEEGDLTDEVDDTLSNASESPIKDLSNFEASTSDSLNTSTGCEDRFTCKICGNAYKHFNSLSSHMKKHKGQTVCPLCFKALSTRSKLRRHLILNHSVHPNDAANMIPLYSRGPSSTKISLNSFIST
ncbi:unnamed protein product [Bemisia tabaci]|uniref:Uncharacterized protein n=1 Tax=Bemisia tabaci TaxID=7038 RepID=A0A9P0A206_BEMTA|nr:unnamed protein product [Bemisia tabaci]